MIVLVAIQLDEVILGCIFFFWLRLIDWLIDYFEVQPKIISLQYYDDCCHYGLYFHMISIDHGEINCKEMFLDSRVNHNVWPMGRGSTWGYIVQDREFVWWLAFKLSYLGSMNDVVTLRIWNDLWMYTCDVNRGWTQIFVAMLSSRFVLKCQILRRTQLTLLFYII